jgi:hypothetical protein
MKNNLQFIEEKEVSKTLPFLFIFNYLYVITKYRKMAYEKHVGVYSNYAEFETDRPNLVSPWVAYVGELNNYKVFYSNGMVCNDETINIAKELDERVSILEKRMITLTEDEYDELVELPEGASMVVHPLGEEPKEISYNPSVYYFTYDPEDLPTEE